MREIKFRAWDKGEKEMITLNDKSWGYFGDCILDPEINTGNYEIMQYTGLKDKNDKDIYEGDILHLEDKGYENFTEIGKKMATFESKLITYEEGTFRFDGITLGDLVINDYLICEVIGNIYENPELLNK